MSRGPAEGPLVSVVVRTRDRKELLAEAMESVAKQSWRPLEAVVVNDGGAPVDDVLVPFRERLVVRLVRHPASRGRAAAANAGVEAARGTWIGFLDDDDLYLPRHVETVLTLAVEGGTGAAYAGCRLLHPAAGSQGEVLAHPFDRELLPLANFIPTCSVLLRREEILREGGFDESLPFLEDWDLWIRLAARIRFAFTPEVTSIYRAGPQSVGGDMADERWEVMGRLFAKHWQRIRPEALVRRLKVMERDIAALRRELGRVAGQLEGCEGRLAEAVHTRDLTAARARELEAQRTHLEAELARVRLENADLAEVVRGAARMRIAGLLRRMGRTPSGGEGSGA